MTNAQQNNQWPHITALLDQEGGHISIGSMPPIEGAAIAVNGQALIASLVRREGEAFPELLQRLDAAIGRALHEGALTNEVNGGRFRLAPSSIRKKRQTPRQLTDTPAPSVARAAARRHAARTTRLRDSARLQLMCGLGAS